MPNDYRVKGSCTAAVIGRNGDAYIIGYSGGVAGEQDIWEEEVDNSAHLDDIFGTDHPDDVGYYVWEGDMEPVYDDAPILSGKWRPATKEDMAALVK